MTDSQINFIQNIENLEALNRNYFQTNRALLEISASRQLSVQPFGSPSAAMGTGPMGLGPMGAGSAIPVSVEINDYVRTNRICCAMIWAYWEGLKKNNKTKFDQWTSSDDDLKELYGIRNCILHNDSDLFESMHRAEPPMNPIYSEVVSKRGEAKNYLKSNILIFDSDHVKEFFQMIKLKFKLHTGDDFK